LLHGDITQGCLVLPVRSRIRHAYACIFRQTFVQLKGLLLLSSINKELVSLGTEENSIICCLPPVFIGAGFQRGLKSATFQLEIVSSIESIQLRVFSTLELRNV